MTLRTGGLMVTSSFFVNWALESNSLYCMRSCSIFRIFLSVGLYFSIFCDKLVLESCFFLITIRVFIYNNCTYLVYMHICTYIYVSITKSFIVARMIKQFHQDSLLFTMYCSDTINQMPITRQVYLVDCVNIVLFEIIFWNLFSFQMFPRYFIRLQAFDDGTHYLVDRTVFCKSL